MLSRRTILKQAAKTATVPTSMIAKMRATAIQNTVTDTPPTRKTRQPGFGS